jgi:hypothetical protein
VGNCHYGKEKMHGRAGLVGMQVAQEKKYYNNRPHVTSLGRKKSKNLHVAGWTSGKRQNRTTRLAHPLPRK